MTDRYKIITEMTKRPEDIWLLGSKGNSPIGQFNEYFTQSEIENVLRPYHDFAANQSGFIIEESGVTFDGDSMRGVRTYDTEENARKAADELSQSSTIPVVKAKNELMHAKAEQYNLGYTAKMYFEFPPPKVQPTTIIIPMATM